jgi:hypothetical protein
LCPARHADERLALAHRHHGLLAIGRNFNPVEAKPRQRYLRVRCVHPRCIAGLEEAHAHDQPAVRDEQRELAIVEPRDMQAGVAPQPELSAAVIDLDAPVGG